MRKKPWTLIAVILTVAMVAGAMGWGAVKYWSAERSKVGSQLSILNSQLQVRIELAHNILTVASRHLSDDDPAVAALAGDIKTFESDASLEEKGKVDKQLVTHAKNLLSALETTDAGAETSFDYDYIKQRFPQELENSREGIIDAYFSNIEHFNTSLAGSVSGVIARIMGISSIDKAIGFSDNMVSPVFFDKQNAVNVPVGMLSDRTRKDIDALNTQLKETGFHFILVAQHFLGGNKVQSYAESLFSVQGLDEKTILLFMVIGEERYYTVTGTAVKKVLSDEDAQTYLARNFRLPYMEHQYDTAVGGFLLAAGSQIAERSGVTISKIGLFGIQAEQTAPAVGWWNDFFLGGDSTKQTSNNYNSNNTERIGFSIPTIVIIGLIFYVVFGRRKTGRQGGGCGCGPLGWILSAFGIANLFGLRKR
jgi:hypothetical protein